MSNISDPELTYKIPLKTVNSYRVTQVSRAITSVKWKSQF